MPSFFEGLKRLAKGEPVYQDNGESTQKTPAEQGSTASQDRPAPKVYIEQTDSDINDGRMRTYADIRNDSEVDVLLDKIRLLGTSNDINATLRANDSKQILIYSGEAPDHDKDHDAELQYKDLSGNYYKARHDVRFEPHDDYYIIKKMPYENTSRI